MTASRLSRSARHALRVATTPRLWGEQIRYWRHGPAGAGWPLFPRSPWAKGVDAIGATSKRALCNICGWSGNAFEGARHVESQRCPLCGSIGRDRFLFLSMQRRVARSRALRRVLETSPRMGDPYRAAMSRWFDYIASDFDERAHVAGRRIDLQAIDLPDASLDLILTPHVLEHVPETDRALSELHRVLAPGGRVLLQVPILQGTTAAPTEPEFHDDHTPVFWRFGPDLAARLRDHGFDTAILCTQPWLDAVKAAAGGQNPWPNPSPEFDVASILAGSDPADLAAVVDRVNAERLGLWEPYQFLVFEAVRR